MNKLHNATTSSGVVWTPELIADLTDAWADLLPNDLDVEAAISRLRYQFGTEVADALIVTLGPILRTSDGSDLPPAVARLVAEISGHRLPIMPPIFFAVRECCSEAARAEVDDLFAEFLALWRSNSGDPNDIAIWAEMYRDAAG